MSIKVSDDKDTGRIEELVCELFNKDMNFSVEENGEEVRIWLENQCLVLNSGGKWYLE